jgi:hypothetical protein
MISMKLPSKKAALAIFLVGAAVGANAGPFAGHLGGGDVLAPALALGVALPIGWAGAGAFRRR